MRRDVIRLLSDLGLTAREIGDILGTSAATVRYRDRVLAAADDLAKRAAIPTKRSPASSRSPLTVTVRIPKAGSRATPVSIDDIDSFKKVRKVPHGLDPVRMAETTFKNGVAAILGERATFKDWGGELRDLSSTHLKIAKDTCRERSSDSGDLFVCTVAPNMAARFPLSSIRSRSQDNRIDQSSERF